MNKEEKATLVEELATQLSQTPTLFAVDYRGISVPQAAELRQKLSEADARFRIVKNRLAKRAVDKAGVKELEPLLEGPTAIAFVRGDAALAAKTIYGFRTEHEILGYKGGLMDGAALGSDQFQAIARLPGRDALNGQFVGLVASPITGLARGLGSMISGLAQQLGQIQEKGLVGEGPPAEEQEETEPETEGAPENADEANDEEQEDN
jgi:large subunit ribosomal protein L10